MQHRKIAFVRLSGKFDLFVRLEHPGEAIPTRVGKHTGQKEQVDNGPHTSIQENILLANPV
jgi:hypothetical protein